MNVSANRSVSEKVVQLQYFRFWCSKDASYSVFACMIRTPELVKRFASHDSSYTIYICRVSPKSLSVGSHLQAHVMAERQVK